MHRSKNNFVSLILLFIQADFLGSVSHMHAHEHQHFTSVHIFDLKKKKGVGGGRTKLYRCSLSRRPTDDLPMTLAQGKIHAEYTMYRNTYSSLPFKARTTAYPLCSSCTTQTPPCDYSTTLQQVCVCGEGGGTIKKRKRVKICQLHYMHTSYAC